MSVLLFSGKTAKPVSASSVNQAQTCLARWTHFTYTKSKEFPWSVRKLEDVVGEWGVDPYHLSWPKWVPLILNESKPKMPIWQSHHCQTLGECASKCKIHPFHKQLPSACLGPGRCGPWHGEEEHFQDSWTLEFKVVFPTKVCTTPLMRKKKKRGTQNLCPWTFLSSSLKWEPGSTKQWWTICAVISSGAVFSGWTAHWNRQRSFWEIALLRPHSGQEKSGFLGGGSPRHQAFKAPTGF